VIALLTTTDAVKLGAARALLSAHGVESEIFDAAAGALWSAIIPQRLMIAERDRVTARRALRSGGFEEAGDGDWDLTGEAGAAM